MKKFISIFVSILILASFFTFTAHAEGAVIAFSPQVVTIGNKVNVTVTVTSNVEMVALEFKLTYDATKVSTTGYAGSIKVVESFAPRKSYTQTFTFDTIAVGAASFKVIECKYANTSAQEIPTGGASATLTIKDVGLSNNANLSALSLSNGNLNPAFAAARTNYNVSVPYETEKITVYANTADKNAKVAIPTNPMTLTVGNNTIKVTVTAQDGSQKIYTIVVKRMDIGEEEEETPDETTPDNPYETVISGKNYEILPEIPNETHFKDFLPTTTEWAGQQVSILRDENNNFSIFYLREVGTTNVAPYIYNSELETFEELKYIVLNNLLYIFSDFPQGMTMPEEFYKTSMPIGNFLVSAYQDTNSQMSDFGYVYCFVNGEYGLYRYDTKEGTIQRYPDIYLVDAPIASTTKPAKDNFIKRFVSLSINDKIMLIALLIAALCVVILIIFLFVLAIQKFTQGNKYVSKQEVELGFDDIVVVGEEEINSKE